MKKRKNIITIIIILLIIIGIRFYYLNYTKELEFDNAKKWSSTFQNKDLTIDSNIKLVGVNMDTILLQDAFKNKSIVLCFSFLNCHSCIEKELRNLSELKHIIPRKVKILGTYDDYKKFKLDYNLVKEYGINNVDFYMVPLSGLKIPVESQNRPFYFYLDKDLKTRKIFLPSTEKPYLTLKYLNEIIEDCYE